VWRGKVGGWAPFNGDIGKSPFECGTYAKPSREKFKRDIPSLVDKKSLQVLMG